MVPAQTQSGSNTSSERGFKKHAATTAHQSLQAWKLVLETKSGSREGSQHRMDLRAPSQIRSVSDLLFQYSSFPFSQDQQRKNKKHTTLSMKRLKSGDVIQ